MLGRLPVKYKLMLLPALALLACGLLLTLTLSTGKANADLLVRIQYGFAPALDLSRDLQEQLGELQRTLQDAVQAEDADGLTRADGIRDRFLARLEEGRTNPVIQKARIDQLGNAFRAYYEVARATSARMLEKRDAATLGSALETMTSRYNQVRANLEASTAHDKAEMADAIAEAHVLQRRSIAVTLVGVLLLSFVLLGLSIWLVRVIVGPLEKLTAAAARIAEHGDLGQQITVTSRDEIGTLAESFRQMVERLRTIPAVISGSVSELGVAVKSLGALTQSQTAALERQASKLGEVSATTAQIRQVSEAAAVRARSMMAVADRAAEMSRTGQAAIEGSIQGLEDIRRQVQAIVGHIAELTEKMLQVSEITERVKGLADRSGILALNASIEAVRAGTQGRGFAIVATEMRSLADQSVESATRIRGIISEVQRSLRSTVKATERGADKVEGGMDQIRASGESLRGIATIVSESTTAARQIVASVGEQDVGIGQVKEAIFSLNEAMEEAVTGVRKAEASTADVRRASDSLSRVVGSFIV